MVYTDEWSFRRSVELDMLHAGPASSDFLKLFVYGR